MHSATPSIWQVDGTHKVWFIDNLYLSNRYLVARFWIPNQMKWMFHYIFLEAIPKLYGMSFSNKGHAIVIDCDTQLVSCIESAIYSHYKTAVHINCS